MSLLTCLAWLKCHIWYLICHLQFLHLCQRISEKWLSMSFFYITCSDMQRVTYGLPHPAIERYTLPDQRCNKQKLDMSCHFSLDTSCHFSLDTLCHFSLLTSIAQITCHMLYLTCHLFVLLATSLYYLQWHVTSYIWLITSSNWKEHCTILATQQIKTLVL